MFKITPHTVLVDAAGRMQKHRVDHLFRNLLVPLHQVCALFNSGSKNIS